MKKLSVFALIFLCVMCLSREGAAYPDYKEILAKSRNINKGLESFKADLKIKTVFMGITCPFKGYLYYKKPDKVRLSIPFVPTALKGKKNVFQDAIPRSFKPEDYSGIVTCVEKIDNKVPCYVLELTPHKDSKIEKAIIWVETHSYLIVKSKVYYSNRSSVLTLQNFKRVGKFILPDRQYVEFDFPSFKSDTYIDYKTYSINVPVDNMFDGGKK